MCDVYSKAVDTFYPPLTPHPPLFHRHGADAEVALLRLVHACFRSVACDAPGPFGGVATPEWAKVGAPAFKTCLAEAIAGAGPVLATAAGELSGEGGAGALACIADTIGPAGHADWSSAYASYSQSSGTSASGGIVACSSVTEATSSAGATANGESGLGQEADGILSSVLRQAQRKQIIGCVPPSALGRDPIADLASVTQDAVLDAISSGLSVLQSCSLTISPGTALPVPVDLMAGVIAGYDLNLVDVSADLPRTATTLGAVLLDGGSGCFPEGVEGSGPDSPAHAIARSLYLRPMQRMHAAYGRSSVMLLETTSLKSRPLTVMDPILSDVNVYKQTLEPSKVKAAIASLGWRGEEAEVDAEPPGTIPDMGDDVKEALLSFIAPYDEMLRVYLGDAVAGKLMKSWTSTKARRGESK